jgi:hypothetical protein
MSSNAERVAQVYSCEYEHEGSRWGLHVKAYDLADADARLKRIGTGKVLGECVALIPWDDVPSSAADLLAAIESS